MNFAKMRSVLLKLFIAFLSLTALIAIISVLSGSFGEIQIKVLVTTCSISAASICAMSCAAFLEKKKMKIAGAAGILAATVAATLVIIGAWSEIGNDHYWKTAATFGVAAICFAHACLLCLPNLARRYRWTQIVSTALITVLGLQVVVAFWEAISDEGYYRFLVANSVLVVLITMIIPICSRLGTNAVEPSQDASNATPADAIPEKLVLQKISDGVFTDDTGRRFQVTELGAGEPIPPGDS
jgi:hypothetical protein